MRTLAFLLFSSGDKNPGFCEPIYLEGDGKLTIQKRQKEKMLGYEVIVREGLYLGISEDANRYGVGVRRSDAVSKSKDELALQYAFFDGIDVYVGAKKQLIDLLKQQILIIKRRLNEYPESLTELVLFVENVPKAKIQKDHSTKLRLDYSNMTSLSEIVTISKSNQMAIANFTNRLSLSYGNSSRNNAVTAGV